MRHRVNQFLRHRPALNPQDWYDTYWRQQGISEKISTFVYNYMQQYSGLEFSRVQPSDRLGEDLHWPLVCWFDWELALYDDFWQCFGLDLSQRCELGNLLTIEELVIYLNRQLFSMNPS